MASDFLMCACLSDMCFSGNTMSMKSDVCFWNFIFVVWNCQICVSEAVPRLLSGIVWFSRVWHCQTFVVCQRQWWMMSDGRFWNIMCWWSRVWGFIIGCDPSDVCFWGGSFLAFDPSEIIWGRSPLALISQRVCHNCLVPGFTDGAGFLFCDDVVKTENLDWIFLLVVSLLLRLAYGRISTVEYVG